MSRSDDVVHHPLNPSEEGFMCHHPQRLLLQQNGFQKVYKHLQGIYKHSHILLPVVPRMLTNYEYSVLSRMILYFYAKKIPHVSVPAHTATSNPLSEQRSLILVNQQNWLKQNVSQISICLKIILGILDASFMGTVVNRQDRHLFLLGVYISGTVF